MRVALRAMVLVGVFAGVGWLTARAVMDHVASRGAMQPEVRLSGAMAGLFAGGAVRWWWGLRWRGRGKS